MSKIHADHLTEVRRPVVFIVKNRKRLRQIMDAIILGET